MPDDVPRWRRRLLDRRRTYLDPCVLAPEADHRFRTLAAAVTEGHDVGVELCASEAQTAEIAVRDDDALILFDIGQSLVLRSLFAALSAPMPQDAAFPILVGAASLHAAAADARFADLLGDVRTETVDPPARMPPEWRDPAARAGVTYAFRNWQTHFDDVTDCFILAHEVHHLLSRKGRPVPVVRDMVESAYDAIVDVATREAGPLTPAEAPTEGARARQTRETAARRAHYMVRRAHLEEELRCDLHALLETVRLVAPQIGSPRRPETIWHVAMLVTALLQMLQLHAAALERTRFRIVNPRGTEFPGDLGLFNLRRVALGVFAGNLYAGACAEEAGAAADAAHLRADRDSRFKTAANALYLHSAETLLGPCMLRLNAALDLVESVYPHPSRSDRAGAPDPVDRLRASGFGYRLAPRVLQRSLGAAASALQAT